MIVYNLKDLTNIPRKGRIIALDIGTKKIGVAICDDTQSIATPKIIIKRQSNLKDFNALYSIIQENPSIAIIFGYPLKMDGSASEITIFVAKFIENFANFLKTTTIPDIPLVACDERLSSFEARNYQALSKSRPRDYDDISASLILEYFLHYLHQSRD